MTNSTKHGHPKRRTAALLSHAELLAKYEELKVIRRKLAVARCGRLTSSLTSGEFAPRLRLSSPELVLTKKCLSS